MFRVEGRIDLAKYEGLEPLYTEYNVSHFARSFTVSNKIAQQQISAQLDDGALTLTLKKAKDAIPRKNKRQSFGRWPRQLPFHSCCGSSSNTGIFRAARRSWRVRAGFATTTVATG